MKISNLCLSYGKNIVLKDITYTFDAGKVYGIVGTLLIELMYKSNRFINRDK